MPYLLILRGRTGSGKSTAMDNLIKRNDLNLKEIEIDLIKEFFKDEISDPKTIFTIAGLVAKDILLHKKKNVVIEGAFDEKYKIETFMNAVDKNYSDNDVKVIRLYCDEKSSISRKDGVLSQETVKGQYKKDMIILESECLINTDQMDENKTVELIIKEINNSS